VEGGSEFSVRAKPRASRSEVLDVLTTPSGDFLEVRLAAPPVDGAANAALLLLLAEALRVPPRAITLLKGAAGRLKRVRVEGLTPDDIRLRLGL
jgi:uncharacterized protein